MGCGTNNQADQILSDQKKQTMAQQNAVGQVNSAFSGFTPAFYKGVGDAYQNFAEPQLQQQYQSTANQLGFKLANQGLDKSSQGRFLNNQLQNTMSQGQTQIGQDAVSQENSLKQQVGNSQANLVAQASSSNNPGNVGASALGVAQGFTNPSSFAPIGQAFNQFGSQYLNNQYNQLYGAGTNSLNTYSAGNPLNPIGVGKAY